MPKYRNEKILNYKSKDLFDIVLDVESYPDFLDWCSGAKILKTGDGFFLAKLVIDFKIYREEYISDIIFYNSANNYNIDITQSDGPFSHLKTKWEFIDLEIDNYDKLSENSNLTAKTLVKFNIDFSFKSKIISGIVSSIFEKISQKMILAFEKRAEKILLKRSNGKN